MYKLWVRNTTWTFLVLWFPCFQRNLKNFPNYVTHGNYPFQPKLPVSFSGNFQWRMEQQTRLKKANIILFSMSRSFRIIPAIPDNFGRFSNTTAYFRTLLKIRKDCWILAKTTECPRTAGEFRGEIRKFSTKKFRQLFLDDFHAGLL